MNAPLLGMAAAAAFALTLEAKDFLWLEAESFADRGEWRLDTQFVHKMGSAYLLAGGVGTPVGAARTALDVVRRPRRPTTCSLAHWRMRTPGVCPRA